MVSKEKKYGAFSAREVGNSLFVSALWYDNFDHGGSLIPRGTPGFF